MCTALIALQNKSPRRCALFAETIAEPSGSCLPRWHIGLQLRFAHGPDTLAMSDDSSYGTQGTLKVVHVVQLEMSTAQVVRLQRQLQGKDDNLSQLQHRIEDLTSQAEQDKDKWERLATQQQDALTKFKAERDEAVGVSRQLQAMVCIATTANADLQLNGWGRAGG
jgi:hypothetical protein